MSSCYFPFDIWYFFVAAVLKDAKYINVVIIIVIINIISLPFLYLFTPSSSRRPQYLCSALPPCCQVTVASAKQMCSSHCDRWPVLIMLIHKKRIEGEGEGELGLFPSKIVPTKK